MKRQGICSERVVGKTTSTIFYKTKSTIRYQIVNFECIWIKLSVLDRNPLSRTAAPQRSARDSNDGDLTEIFSRF